MKNNPMNSLVTPEQRKIYEKIRFYSFFYPFKRKRLNQVGDQVKKILDGYGIHYPVIFAFKKSREFSRYAIANIESKNYTNYKIFIHYNPRFIKLEFKELVKTGLHEYCHLIYRQKEDFADKNLQKIVEIDFDSFTASIEYLTNKFLSDVSSKNPALNKEILNDSLIIEDIFVEYFAEYLLGSQNEILVEEKKHFETIINTHIQIMRGIRQIKFGES